MGGVSTHPRREQVRESFEHVLWTWNKFWKIGISTVMNCENENLKYILCVYTDIYIYTVYIYIHMYIHIIYMSLYYMILYLYIIFMCMYSINGNPLQYSCLKNPMDRGAWRATVHGVAKSWIRLSDFTFTIV